jgi:carboxymethylenebutenolidase
VDPRITELYNEYVHGDMPRREFVHRVTRLAGSAAAASMFISMLEPDWARGQQVDESDPGIEQSTVVYPGAPGEVRGTLVRPAGASGPLPGVLVIHENRGLNAHIEDVARRVAKAGFIALAPDGLSYMGGAPADQEEARDLFGRADRDRITADVVAGVPWLAGREDCTGKVGAVGFCYGGGVALVCAVEEKATAAAVCFYGRALSEDQVTRLRVPVMMHYAGRDERINSMIPEFRSALDRNEVAYSIHMYPGTGHGFHNDTSEARYDEPAARLAWSRTITFFDHWVRI